MDKMIRSGDAHLGVVRTLLTREQIEKRIDELAQLINRTYVGKDLVLVGTLKGSIPFYASLLEKVTIPCRTEFVSASSYGASTSTSGNVVLNHTSNLQIENAHVLLVEDIVDTGLSLEKLLTFLKTQNTASFKIMALLDKPSRRRVPVYADYIGFTIEDYFVVGFGLDYNQYYRNLPDIGILDTSLLEE